MSNYCYLNFYVPKSQKHEVCEFFKILIPSGFSDVPITIGKLKFLPSVSPSDELLEFTSKITNMGVTDEWVQNMETCYKILQRVTERFQTSIGVVWPDLYIEKTTDSYHDYVRSTVLNPSKLGKGIVLKDICNSVRFCTDAEPDCYAYVNLVLNNPNKEELVLVIIAEGVNKNGMGINHPFNILHHLVDLKTQLEVGLQFDGLANKHVRGLVVSKSIEDEDFKARLLKNGLEYLETL